MAFKGDLRNISLFDIFQTLNTNNQTGVLVLQREGVTKKVFFSPQGVRVFFTRSFRGLKLGEVFVRRGMVTPQDVEILLLEQKKRYRPMGQLLVESGKVPREEVDRVLRCHAEDEIFEIFSWKSGTFSFYDGQTIEDAGNVPLSEVVLDPAGLCLEAARRLDEMEMIRAVVPNNEQFYVAAEGAGEPDRATNDAKLCAVYDCLRAPACIDDVRDAVGLSQFDILRALYLLLQNGFVRPLTPEELLDTARAARAAEDPERAARLFERVLAAAPENRAVLEECVEVVRKLDDPKRLAGHLAMLGAVHVEAGELDSGVELLEQSLRLDPDNLRALFALRRCHAGQGDPDRAAEISLRIARAFAEKNELDEAIKACRTGLEISPKGIALRFYLGQLLARAEKPEEAKHELYGIVRETESSRRAMRSAKAHDLLSSCYRLILKIDPDDAQAAKGLAAVDRLRASDRRRRVLLVRGGIAAALLAAIGAVALPAGGPDADEMFARVVAAQRSEDLDAVIEATDALVGRHPGSPEASRAMEIRREVERQRSTVEQERRRREEALRQEITADLDALRAALADRPYLEAVGFVGPFLGRLAKPEASFLRKSVVPYVEDAIGKFLDRVIDQFEKDRQRLAACDRQLKARSDKTVEELREMEDALGAVRGRAWPASVPTLVASFDAVRASPYIGSADRAIQEAKKRLLAGAPSFGGLDDLYFAVRSLRLRTTVDAAIRDARGEGRKALQMCDFERARALYARAYDEADSVAEETPRERFYELLAHIERTGILQEAREKIELIDMVTQTLAEVERLEQAGDYAMAFRLFRPLVAQQHLIQFERRFAMPYRIQSTPDGAEVFLDGKPAGRTPLNVKVPIVEQVKVRVSRKGFEDAERTLQALDPELTGTLELPLLKRAAWRHELAGPVQASLSVTGDLVLAASRNGRFYGIRAADGARAFLVETNVLEGIRARPVADAEHAYAIAINGTLHTVRLRDGATLPVVKLPGQVYEDPCLVDGTLYAATRARRLVAVRNGQVLWDKPLPSATSTNVLHLDGLLFLGTAEGEVLVHDAATGESRRKLAIPTRSSFLGGLSSHKGFVLAGAEDGHLYAFLPDAVTPRWAYPTGGAVKHPAASFGNAIFVPAADGSVHEIDESGQRVARYELGGAAVGVPAAANGFLYAVSSGGTLSAFDLTRRRAWWDHALNGRAPDGVVAGAGHVFVLVDGARVVAFDVDGE